MGVVVWLGRQVGMGEVGWGGDGGDGTVLGSSQEGRKPLADLGRGRRFCYFFYFF